jgi:hypothetical protein
MSVWLAVAAAMAALVAGGSLFDRATSAVEHDASWKDVLSPRDGAFKVVSIFVLSALSVGIIWICIAADGLVGFGEAAILIAIVAGLCWASSYVDLMLRGLAYHGAVGAYAVVWLLRTVVRLGWITILLSIAAVTALVLLVVHVVAWPFTLIRSFFDRRPTPPSTVASAS